MINEPTKPIQQPRPLNFARIQHALQMMVDELQKLGCTVELSTDAADHDIVLSYGMDDTGQLILIDNNIDALAERISIKS